MFCQLFPSRACVVGNDRVRSLDDNVALRQGVEVGTVRFLQLSERQPGWELGMDGMVNGCELLINTVNHDEPKLLTGLNQNGKWSSIPQGEAKRTRCCYIIYRRCCTTGKKTFTCVHRLYSHLRVKGE